MSTKSPTKFPHNSLQEPLQYSLKQVSLQGSPHTTLHNILKLFITSYLQRFPAIFLAVSPSRFLNTCSPKKETWYLMIVFKIHNNIQYNNSIEGSLQRYLHAISGFRELLHFIQHCTTPYNIINSMPCLHDSLHDSLQSSIPGSWQVALQWSRRDYCKRRLS